MQALERKLILDQIEKQDSLSIFRKWIDSGRVDRDPMKQQSVGTLLARSLQAHSGNHPVYSEIGLFIADPRNAQEERGYLLMVLGFSATKDSVEWLIRSASALEDKELKRVALEQIRAVGDAMWGGRFHEELSPALEQVWRESQDPAIFSAAALAVAKVGASRGVESLLTAAFSGGTRRHDARGNSALTALDWVVNPSAVAALETCFSSELQPSEAAIFAGRKLVAIGDSTASKALLKWLQNADERAAPYARENVVQTRTEVMLNSWGAALNPAIPFHSEKIRDAIREGLNQYHSNRKAGP